MFTISNYPIFFVLLCTFLCCTQITAQKTEKEYSKIFNIDADGKIIVEKGYKVLTFKDNAIVYDFSKWKILKNEGSLQVVKKGKKGDGAGVNSCPECEISVCNPENGQVCVIRGNSCTCQSQNNCDCEDNEICVNGRCQPNNSGAPTSLRKVALFD